MKPNGQRVDLVVQVGRELIMPKVKILEIYGEYCDSCDVKPLTENITDWEEVTDKEYQMLKDWVCNKNNYHYRKIDKYILAVYSLPSLNTKLVIKDFLKRTKEKKERELKKKQTTEKRKATMARKKRERELKQLKELEKKYGK